MKIVTIALAFSTAHHAEEFGQHGVGVGVVVVEKIGHVGHVVAARVDQVGQQAVAPVAQAQRPIGHRRARRGTASSDSRPSAGR